MTEEKKERIAKVMARAGLCSRRDAERWIEEGRVVVDGKKLTSPAFTVDDSNEIVVDGKPLPKAEKTRLFLYHKPAGLVTTAKDEKGRQTVFDKMPPELPRVIAVGRLDMNTEGLLILTNDGELARQLELPSTGWLRRYRVRVFGSVTQERLDKLKDGITVDGIKYGAIEATLEGKHAKPPKKDSEGKPEKAEWKGANCWLQIGIREGKNREVRKVCEALGLKVNRLIRISYGPFQLGKLERGAIREVPQKVLNDQIKGFRK